VRCVRDVMVGVYGWWPMICQNAVWYQSLSIAIVARSDLRRSVASIARLDALCVLAVARIDQRCSHGGPDLMRTRPSSRAGTDRERFVSCKTAYVPCLAHSRYNWPMSRPMSISNLSFPPPRSDVVLCPRPIEQLHTGRGRKLLHISSPTAQETIIPSAFRCFKKGQP
jgi:hypothetical protein